MMERSFDMFCSQDIDKHRDKKGPSSIACCYFVFPMKKSLEKKRRDPTK